MGTAYAVLGLVVGIVIDEAIRRGMRNSARLSGPQQRLRRPQLAARDGEQERSIRRPLRRFLAQDFYDR